MPKSNQNAATVTDQQQIAIEEEARQAALELAEQSRQARINAAIEDFFDEVKQHEPDNLNSQQTPEVIIENHSTINERILADHSLAIENLSEVIETFTIESGLQQPSNEAVQSESDNLNPQQTPEVIIENHSTINERKLTAISLTLENLSNAIERLEAEDPNMSSDDARLTKIARKVLSEWNYEKQLYSKQLHNLALTETQTNPDEQFIKACTDVLKSSEALLL